MYILLDFCQKSSVLEVINFILKALKLVSIIVPIALIVLIAIDLIKGVISGSQDEIKKIFNIVIKRVIYAALVFFAPMIVNVIVGILGDLGVNYMECIENATDEKIAFYKAQEEAESSGSGGGFSSISPTASSSSKSSSKKTQTSTSTSKSKSDVAFTITKDKIVIGHYNKKVNKYTIVLKSSGKKLSNSNYTFTSSNPAIASVNSKGVVSGKFGGQTTITVTSKKNKSNSKKVSVLVTHTLYTRVKVTKTVTGVSAKTGKKVKLRSGTTGIFNGIGPDNSPNGYLLGDTIKVGSDYIKISSKYVKPYKYYVSSIYSKADVENFINQFNFSSKTKYLFWSNSGTGMEYMFKGKKGNWKLYKQFYINVGDAAHLMYSDSARTGVHFNYYVGETDTRSGYTYKVIWKRSSSTHRTNPWHEYGTGDRYPASHGCTRFQTKDIIYLLSIHSKIQNSKLIDF